MADEGRSRLGRGLASLIGDMGDETPAAAEPKRGQRRVPVEYLRANPRNPRQIFADADLDGLSASIKERGIIQPIVVRAVPNAANAYEIIAGERRWRAAQRAELHDVPIVVLDVSDGEALELAIIENVQRADLNPLEEALGYQSLADQFKHSQDEIAKAVGKSRSHVANTLRLLKLPETVKAYINAGTLSAGHARALVGQPNAETMAREIVDRGLNVRQVEALVKDTAAEPASGKAGKGGTKNVTRFVFEKDADTRAVEKRLSDALGLAVTLTSTGGEAGHLRIDYTTLDQIDDVIRRLGG